MARIGFAETKTILSRAENSTKLAGRCLTKITGTDPTAKTRGSTEEAIKKKEELSYWVPHPRTGIYYPKGHDWVMKDVPASAASFRRTYWMRSIEGVDNDDHHNLFDD